MNAHDVMITGVGMISSLGVGSDATYASLSGVPSGEVRERSLATFSAAPYLSDRKMLKAVSQTDSFALAAVEELRRNMSSGKALPYDSERVGFYVGASPALASDNLNYEEAIRQSEGATGHSNSGRFARHAMEARPNTLLIGLPNNVLCYGSMIFGAQGPNSNYTSFDVSGHLALSAAAKRVARNQIDLAVAGGFSGASERAYHSVFQWVSEEQGLPFADGAMFFSLERRAAAVSRGAVSLARLRGAGFANDLGLNATDATRAGLSVETVENAVTNALEDAEASPDDVGLVLVSTSGVPAINGSVSSALSRVFAKRREFPALGDFSARLGDLVEASGLVEIALGEKFFKSPEKAWDIGANRSPIFSKFGDKVNPTNSTALIIRGSILGECSCLVLQYEVNP